MSIDSLDAQRRPKQLDVEIVPAWKASSVTLAKILLTAYENDKCVDIMCRGEEIWSVLLSMIDEHINSDHFKFRVAVDKERGKIVGWLSLGIIVSHDALVDRTVKQNWPTAASLRELDMRLKWPEHQGNLVEDPKRDRLRQKLADTLHDRSVECQQRWIGGIGRRMVINTLVTDPKYLSQGVASKLLTWATEYSAYHKWPLFAQIPEERLGFFKEKGFRHVGSFGLPMSLYTRPVVGGSFRSLTRWDFQKWYHVTYHSEPNPEFEKRPPDRDPRLQQWRKKHFKYWDALSHS